MLLSTDAISIGTRAVERRRLLQAAHGQIFAAIAPLYESGQPADAVTVADELRPRRPTSMGADPAALVSLQANTPSSANAPTTPDRPGARHPAPAHRGERRDLRPRLQRARRRRGRHRPRRADDPRRRRARASRPSARWGSCCTESVDWIEERGKGETITGTATGSPDLDNILLGLQPSSLTIVGCAAVHGQDELRARACSPTSARILAVPALLFSLEMSHLELSQRAARLRGAGGRRRMRTGQLGDADWQKMPRDHAARDAPSTSTTTRTSRSWTSVPGLDD